MHPDPGNKKDEAWDSEVQMDFSKSTYKFFAWLAFHAILITLISLTKYFFYIICILSTFFIYFWIFLISQVSTWISQQHKNSLISFVSFWHVWISSCWCWCLCISKCLDKTKLIYKSCLPPESKALMMSHIT